MSSEAPPKEDDYDSQDELVEESDSDSEAPPPKKLGPSLGDSDESTGKGFMAVRPYIGAIVTPSNAQAVDRSRPTHALALDWVFGYRAFDSKSNIAVNTRGHIIYPVAGLIVIYNKVKRTQTYFRGHNDDVRCLAQNPIDRDWIVSGQNATVVNGRSTAPHVCVWNSADLTQVHTLKLPSDARAVRAVSFSPDGNYIAAVANDDSHTVSIWDWRRGVQLASKEGDRNAIFQIRWNHVRPAQNIYEIVTVGTKHAYFWTFDSSSKTLKSKRVTLGGAFPTQTWNSVTFSERGHACLGGFDGTILICKQGTNGVASKAVSVSAATGSKTPAKVFSLDTYQGGIVAGLSDRTVVQFDSKLAIEKVFQFKHKVTTVYVRGKDLYVGTQNSEIFELKDGLDPAVSGGPIEGRFQPITTGHFDGELWAVATMRDSNRVVSAGEDNSLIMWDLANRSVLHRSVINPKAGTAPKVKKAATTSLHPQNQCARAVAVSPDEAHILVGTNDGRLSIHSGSDLTIQSSVDLNPYGQRKVNGQEGNWIQTIEFNPQGTLVAVGTHGSVIVILDPKSKFAVKSVIQSHHAFLTHMDWSADGELLRSNDGAYELLYHDCSDPSKPRQVGSASSVKDTNWSSENCPFSYGSLGVIQGDGTSVNSVARSPDRTLVASADDFGKVCLYRYPCPEKGATHIAHNGHSSHVTSVRWTPDGQTLVSTGGHDLGLFVWKLTDFQPDEGHGAFTVQQ